jgi:hypothetical protein
MNGTPAHAFASHRTRASAIARHYALEHPLNVAGGMATESNTIELIAHLQAASDDPDFLTPSQEPSRFLAPVVLRSLNQGHGQVGTQFGVHDDGTTQLIFRRGDYDMALIGLMVIAYRYRALLSEDDVSYILEKLVPPAVRGMQNPAFESYYVAPTEDVPETENHLLMITRRRRIHSP